MLPLQRNGKEKDKMAASAGKKKKERKEGRHRQKCGIADYRNVG
jgi:hypothetical protein